MVLWPLAGFLVHGSLEWLRLALRPTGRLPELPLPSSSLLPLYDFF